jgi:hypothetical protein
LPPPRRGLRPCRGFRPWRAIPAQQRFLWEQIEEQLDRLHNRLSPDDRKRIEALLIKKIGKSPTKAQRDELDRKREQFFEGFAERIAKIGIGRRR